MLHAAQFHISNFERQAITHIGLPTLDEIIQGPTITQIKHELFSNSFLVLV